jgi:hypothetical protein
MLSFLLIFLLEVLVFLCVTLGKCAVLFTPRRLNCAGFRDLFGCWESGIEICVRFWYISVGYINDSTAINIGFGYGKEVLVNYVVVFRDGDGLFFIDSFTAVAGNDSSSGCFAPTGRAVCSRAGCARV